MPKKLSQYSDAEHDIFKSNRGSANDSDTFDAHTSKKQTIANKKSASITVGELLPESTIDEMQLDQS